MRSAWRRGALGVLMLVMVGLEAPAARQVGPSLYGEMRWRMIGPHRGGRTKAAAGIPSQPNVFYIGVVNGGVWKTTDYGRTWFPIFDDQPTGSIERSILPVCLRRYCLLNAGRRYGRLDSWPTSMTEPTGSRRRIASAAAPPAAPPPTRTYFMCNTLIACSHRYSIKSRCARAGCGRRSPGATCPHILYDTQLPRFAGRICAATCHKAPGSAKRAVI